jgi:replicative DNA helicase
VRKSQYIHRGLKFNDATTDGLEWNTLTVMGGRPGSGKTLIKDQIIRESFELKSK